MQGLGTFAATVDMVFVTIAPTPIISMARIFL